VGEEPSGAGRSGRWGLAGGGSWWEAGPVGAGLVGGGAWWEVFRPLRRVLEGTGETPALPLSLLLTAMQ
jgi:hypothetical protein